MKHWKLHLVWAVVALVLGAGFGQFLASRKEAGHRTRERSLREEIRALKSEKKRLEEETLAAADGKNIPEDPEAEPSARPGEPTDPERRDRDRGRAPLTFDQIMTLLKSSSERNHWRALQAIGRLKDRDQKIALLRELFARAGNNVKSRAVRMLDDIGPPEGTMMAIDVLQGEGPSWLHARAAYELGEIGGPEAIAALQQAYRDGDLRLKTSSALALKRLGQPSGVQDLIARTSEMLASPDGAVREDAVETMGRLEDPSALPFLAKALQDPNSDVRHDAINALEDIEVPESLELLRQALNDPNPSVVENAKDAIEDLGKKLSEQDR